MKSIAILLNMVLIFLLASCRGDDEPVQPGNQSGTATVFTLRLEKPVVLGAGVTTTGNGTWGGDYDKYPGDGFESSITPGFVTLTIRNVATGNVVVVPMNSTLVGNEYYQCNGTTTSYIEPGLSRIEIMANSRADLFSIDDLPIGIPMWGVSTHVMTGDRQQDLGMVNLLRAVAKIDVQLNDSLSVEGFTIKECTLGEFNPRGFTVPASAYDTNVSHTGDLAWDASKPYFCFRPSMTTHQANRNFTINAMRSAYLYPGAADSTRVTANTLARLLLPEVERQQPDSIPVSIVLNYRGNDIKYDNAFKVATPIIRNHYLLYTIDRVSPRWLTYWVCGWHEKETDIPSFQ